jgi:hypothetical protein
MIDSYPERYRHADLMPHSIAARRTGSDPVTRLAKKKVVARFAPPPKSVPAFQLNY